MILEAKLVFLEELCTKNHLKLYNILKNKLYLHSEKNSKYLLLLFIQHLFQR